MYMSIACRSLASFQWQDLETRKVWFCNLSCLVLSLCDLQCQLVARVVGKQWLVRILDMALWLSTVISYYCTPVYYQRCRTIAPKEVPPPFLCCTTNGTGGNQCNVYCCEYSIRLNLPLSCRGSPCLSFPGIRQQQLHHRSKHWSSRCEPHAQYTHAPPMSQAALFAHCMYVLYDTHYTSTQDLQYVCYRMCGYIYKCSAKPHVLQRLLTSLNKCH